MTTHSAGIDAELAEMVGQLQCRLHLRAAQKNKIYPNYVLPPAPRTLHSIIASNRCAIQTAS
jgi:hypothetical protein